LVLVLFLVLGSGPYEAWASEPEEQRLLELINEYRQANGVGPLTPSGALSTSAEHHSQDMSSHDFFSHNTKESSYYPSGFDFADRAVQEGYPANASTGENIARGQPTAEEVFEDWRLSPDHNATMLNEGYTAAGIGHDGSYWTADFGSEADTALSAPELQEPVTETRKAPAEEPPSSHPPTEPATSEKSPPPQHDSGPSSADQTTEEQPQREESSLDPDPGEEAPPRMTSSTERSIDGPTMEQYDPGRETSLDITPPSGEEAIPPPPVEPKTGEQTPIPQPGTERTVLEQAQQEEGSESAPEPREEPTPRITSSAQPTLDGPAIQQYLLPEEILSLDPTLHSDEEQAVREPAAEMTPQAPTGQQTGEGNREVSAGEATPAETEAMENALAARGVIPEDLIRQTAFAPEPTGLTTTTLDVPATVAPGTTGNRALGNSPALSGVATKELPRTSGAPLSLLVSGLFLLTSGLLIQGIVRKQKGL